ncbi:27946_t:CDS:2 [Dentiscutata erythropus]|uniref:27946_t:CDS:1 n=1 Tax=Dentiscutata erythropus TaxID=1348616 RepID=A0A9N8W292_9GLOM|nr:27946_t:CDS:2 [Dentiscutata erythropus]
MDNETSEDCEKSTSYIKLTSHSKVCTYPFLIPLLIIASLCCRFAVLAAIVALVVLAVLAILVALVILVLVVLAVFVDRLVPRAHTCYDSLDSHVVK